MNIERPTSNIEWGMGKDEETDSKSGRKAARVFGQNQKNVEQPPNWRFVFHSMLDVRCSSFKTPIV
jgi:hypothetical protein